MRATSPEGGSFARNKEKISNLIRFKPFVPLPLPYSPSPPQEAEAVLPLILSHPLFIGAITARKKEAPGFPESLFFYYIYYIYVFLL